MIDLVDEANKFIEIDKIIKKYMQKQCPYCGAELTQYVHRDRVGNACAICNKVIKDHDYISEIARVDSEF